MSIVYSLKYSSTWDNNNKPLQITEGSIFLPISVEWYHENTQYQFEYCKDNFITNVYVNQQFILVIIEELGIPKTLK